MRSNRRKLAFSEADIGLMVELYVAKWQSVDQIARRFGCLRWSIQQRLVKRGVVMRPRTTWRRLRIEDNGNGYFRWQGRYVHRIVAEAWRDSPLLKGEVVHHRDGDKTNNHPDNLEILPSQSAHCRRHSPKGRQVADNRHKRIESEHGTRRRFLAGHSR